MKSILITGATGNTGTEIIRYLLKSNTSNRIIAGVRNIEKAKKIFKDYQNLEYVEFDFENPNTFSKSLKNIDIVFLLRPPHISDTDKYFKPLISKLSERKIQKVVFLSVQGAEKSKVIPHNKIEALIKESGLGYIFMRPSYFMQNLTTTLLKDIKNKRRIILPAGNAKFNWVDVCNIGEIGAILINNFDKHKNNPIEITGNENSDFVAVTNLINDVIDNKIQYANTNPLKFYRIKRQEGVISGKIIVMILLHYLPRFQKEPKISNNYFKLTNRTPTSLKEFIIREKHLFD